MRFSEKTYNKFFDQYYMKVVGTLIPLVGYEYAEEAAVEAFMCVWDMSFNDEYHARNYLFLRATGLALKSYKKHEVYNRRLEDIIYDTADSVPSPEHVVIARDKLKQVEKAFEHLPPKCRRVLELICLWGLGTEEVCRILHIKQSTVWNQKKRGLRLVKEQLKTFL